MTAYNGVSYDMPAISAGGMTRANQAITGQQYESPTAIVLGSYTRPNQQETAEAYAMSNPVIYTMQARNLADTAYVPNWTVNGSADWLGIYATAAITAPAQVLNITR